jgi:hypothetical protein
VKIKSQKDFFAGLMYLVIGGAFAWGATGYTVGKASRMGPGYFPLLLGSILALIGAVVLFKAMVVDTEDGEKIGSIAWKPLGYIIGSNLAFGILLGGLPSIGVPAMGLIVAIFALVFIASRAGDVYKVKEVFILSIVLAILSYLAFIKLLNLQFQVWPSFIVN